MRTKNKAVKPEVEQMKHNQRRDLLVMLNNEHRSQQAIDHEVKWLHAVLFHIEELDNFCKAHEVLDLNRYKVINNIIKVRKIVVRKTMKAFEFVSNKN